jgi:protein TonB
MATKEYSPRQSARDRKRAARDKRLSARDGVKAKPARVGEDPLLRSERTDAKQAWMIPLLLVGAAVAHLAFTVGIGAVADAFALSDGDAEDEKIIVEITEPPPPIEPEPVVEPEPEPEPEPVIEEPKPKPEPKVKPEPEPEPEPPPEVEPPKPPPRRVIGLDLGATVEGGTGPAFATGNALDGKTEKKAVDPKDVKQDPGPSTEVVKGPTSPNRVATIVPRKNVKIVKPKRKQRVKPEYPAILKAQGIEGNVVVEVQISAEGIVKSVEIIAPAKEAEFNEAAKLAAMKEIFEPATRDGKAISFRLSFTYRYRISD